MADNNYHINVTVELNTSQRTHTRDGHADADIRINFRIIRQYRAISDICRIYPTYASMRIAKNIRMAIPSSNPIITYKLTAKYPVQMSVFFLKENL